MAVRLADTVTYLTADRTDLNKGLRQAEKDIEGGGNRFGSILSGVGMAVGLGVANIAMEALGQVQAFMGDAVGAASDMNETVSKTGVLFGESADAVVAWAETAATGLGQSKQQALDAASTFAIFGQAAGLAGDDLTTFSTDFVGLASDLASFNNTTPEEAIEAIGAALRGESEPLRRYGVMLDDAALKAEAMKLGIYDGNGALTQQQKILAAQAAIYAQTSTAQGDFARTSDGLANQQRILDAQWQNMQATIGQALLPVVLALTTQLNNLVQAVLPPLTEFITNQVTPAFQMLADMIGPAISTVIGWFQQMGQTVQTQADGPLAYIAEWWQENLPLMQEVAENVIGAITAFWEEFGDDITATMTMLFGWIQRFWDTQLKTLLDLVTVALQLLTGDFEGAGETLKGILERWYDFFHDIITSIVDGVRDWFASVDWVGLGRSIIVDIADGIRGAAGFLWDAALEAAQGAYDGAMNWLTGGGGDGSRSGRAGGFDLGGFDAAVGRLAPSTGSGAGVGALAAGFGGPLTVTINVYGASDARAVGGAARDGLLDALRSAGWRG